MDSSLPWLRYRSTPLETEIAVKLPFRVLVVALGSEKVLPSWANAAKESRQAREINSFFILVRFNVYRKMKPPAKQPDRD
jgi:hypothetical protein